MDAATEIGRNPGSKNDMTSADQTPGYKFAPFVDQHESASFVPHINTIEINKWTPPRKSGGTPEVSTTFRV